MSVCFTLVSMYVVRIMRIRHDGVSVPVHIATTSEDL